MTTLKVATGALLGTVTVTATAVTDVVKSVSDGARMLNDFTNNARVLQQKNIIANQAGSIKEIRNNAAIRILTADQALHEYVKANPQQAEQMDKVLAELDIALA